MEKIYTSTRNKALARTPKEAVLKGIAEDGGLFVYDGLDTLSLPLQDMMQMTYEEMAETILQLLLPDFSREEVQDCVKNAYQGKFTDPQITPLHKAKDTNILELFHGPTCAFKDVGLRMLPQLMSKSLKQHPDEKVMILTATSGDTGKAALEGFLDVERTGITVFYPDNGVSNIQRLQMVTT
ncbi:MAG: threonine synthase, partial [Clostridium sp.]